MIKTTVAFDIDGTLIDCGKRQPRHEILAMLWSFRLLPNVEVILWSGGGKEYAEQRARELFLSDLPCIGKPIWKGEPSVDISFDDQECKLGKINIRV